MGHKEGRKKSHFFRLANRVKKKKKTPDGIVCGRGFHLLLGDSTLKTCLVVFWVEKNESAEFFEVWVGV